MKLEEFQKILKDKKIDFALFFNSDSGRVNPNMLYFSGYTGIGALVVGWEREFLMVPKMEYEGAKKSRIKNVYYLDKKRLFESVFEAVSKQKIRRKIVGIDKSFMTLQAYSAFRRYFRRSRTADVSIICSKLRETKTLEEVRMIRAACRMTDDILKRCLRNFRGFKTEADVAAFLEHETRKRGCTLAFQPIVASGAGSSQPHYDTKDAKLKKGFCVIDFGIRYRGYCSDVSRTIYIGRPSKKEAELYNLLSDAQKETINYIKEEKNIPKIIVFLKKRLGKYNKQFIHSLGHGIGVEVHELPNLSENSKNKLKENSVFTIEPGIYFPGKFGIRIEDDILITGKMVEALSSLPKDLLITAWGK